MKIKAVVVMAGIALLLAGLISRTAYAQDPELGAVIQGVVFSDSNRNAVQDEGEIGMPDALLEFTGSEVEFVAHTDDQGRFRVDVPLGSWEVALQPVAGYEVGNDRTRSVTFEAEGQLEAQADFALWVLDEGNEPIDPQPEENEGSDEGEAVVDDHPEDSREADDEAENSSDAEEALPTLLPESGRAVHPMLALGALALAGMVTGPLLVWWGRSLEAGR